MKAIVALELWKQLVILVPLGAMLVASTYTDLKERKVYNKVTYSAFGVGLLAHTIAFGPMGFVWALVAAIATFIVCLVFFIFIPAGGFGGGDLKLLTATAAFVGGQGILAISWYSVLAGAALGLVMAIYTGYLWDMLKNMFRFLRGIYRLVVYRTRNLAEKMEVDDRSRVPYAAAVLAGAVLAYSEEAFGWPDWYGTFMYILANG
jgi:prepilin peptidase CpaA